MKNRKVLICTGGGGRALPAKLGVEDVALQLSSRTRFGICPMSPLARNAGQMLKQVQHDNFESLRAVVDRSQSTGGRAGSLV